MQLNRKHRAVLGVGVAILSIIVFGLLLSLIENTLSSRREVTSEKAAPYVKQPTFYLKNEEGDITYCSYDKIDSFLVIGTDSSGNEEATGEDYEGNLADFLLLVNDGIRYPFSDSS